MSNELELYYQNRMAMFASEGWKQLIEDARKIEASINTLDSVTVETLDFKKGELSIIRWLIDLERISKEAHSQMEDSDESA